MACLPRSRWPDANHMVRDFVVSEFLSQQCIALALLADPCCERLSRLAEDETMSKRSRRTIHRGVSGSQQTFLASHSSHERCIMRTFFSHLRVRSW